MGLFVVMLQVYALPPDIEPEVWLAPFIPPGHDSQWSAAN